MKAQVVIFALIFKAFTIIILIFSDSTLVSGCCKFHFVLTTKHTSYNLLGAEDKNPVFEME